MLHRPASIAKLLFWINVVPGVMSVLCFVLPNPLIWLLVAVGWFLLAGYWRLMRGQAVWGLAADRFWLVSAAANGLGALAYVLLLRGTHAEGAAALGVLAAGVVWTLGTLAISLHAYRLTKAEARAVTS